MRLREKTDTSVNFVSNVSVTKVPSTANKPTTSGRPAATRLPKTTASATKVIGAVRRSALARSLSA